MAQAPKQVLMNITFTESLNINFDSGKEHFTYGHVPVMDTLAMVLFPCCCATVPYTSGHHNITYKMEQLWASCGCTWASYLDGQRVGVLQPQGCCSNGALFCCCPCLTCDGKIKLMGLADGTGQERLLLARQLFPCWSYINPLLDTIGLLSVVVRPIQGCYMYTQDREVQTISQPVFKGPWTRADPTEPVQVGKLTLSYRYQPVSLCCAAPILIKTSFQAAEGTRLSKDELTALSLLLQLYGNLPTPCKFLGCTSSSLLRIPTGIWCFDLGMMAEYKWESVADAQKSTE